MFDRIAPRYDLLNRAMTAGLDGRWRQAAAAAADLAAGDRALDCCTGTGDLALRAGRPGDAARARWSASTSPRRCWPGRATRPPRAARAGRRSGRATPWPCRSPDDSFDAATVAFGIRNVADLDRGIAEMARVVRPGGRVVILEITTPARLRRFYERLVRPRRARASAACSAATAPPTRTCRPRSGASPSRRSWPRAWRRPGLTDVRWRAPGAAGIVALHHGRVARDLHRAAARPRSARCAAPRRLRGAPARGGRRPRRPRSASPAADTLAAGGKRVRPLLVFCSAPARGARRSGAPRGPALGRRRPWSWCTWRRWCTTTCSTARRMRRGPAHRGRSRSAPSGPSAPATSCSPARSASSPAPARPRAVQRAGRRRPRPLAGRDRPAARRLRPRPHRGGLPRALPAQDGGALLGRLPARAPLVGRRRAPRPRSGWRPSARTWAWPSRSSTTSSTWPGAPAATGKRRGTDLVRRHGDPAGDPGPAARARPAPREVAAGAARAPALEAPLRPAGRPRGPAHRARAGARLRRGGARARSRTGPLDGADVDALLEIADGVVDRYS